MNRRHKLITISVLLVIISCLIISISKLSFKNDKLQHNEKKDEVVKEDYKPLFDNTEQTIMYSDFKNYNENNLERYVSYKEKNSDLFESEVIWKVNMDLDYPPYSNIKEISNPDNYVAILNENRKVKDDYKPNDLVVLNFSNEEFEVRYAVNVMFSKLIENLNNNDHEIKVTRAYDTESTQYRKGHDEHLLGLSIDIDYDSQEVQEYLNNNIHHYGFIISEDNKKHLRFVSKEIAIDMKERNINMLDEYVDKYLNTR